MVRTYIQSEELAHVFEEIRTTYKIHLDEAGNISLSLNAVFLGVRPAGEFTNLLKASLEQNGDKYDSILKDVNEKIFKVFRNKLEHKDNANGASPEQKPAPAKTPLERLESGTVEHAEPIALSPDTGAPKEPVREKKPYTGSDPYRESVE